VESTTAEGDLRVWVKRPIDAKFGDRYSWSFQIDVINGGIVEEPDPLAAMYIAPSEGYTNSYQFSKAGDAPAWGYRSRRRFYIKTRGWYGRIALDVFAYYDVKANDGTFGIKYVINPSGSRVLR